MSGDIKHRFRGEFSSFSAIISLGKSVIRDKNGNSSISLNFCKCCYGDYQSQCFVKWKNRFLWTNIWSFAEIHIQRIPAFCNFTICDSRYSVSGTVLWIPLHFMILNKKKNLKKSEIFLMVFIFFKFLFIVFCLYTVIASDEY